MSMASSMPASQLLNSDAATTTDRSHRHGQSQSQSQSAMDPAEELREASSAAASLAPLSDARVQVFRRALGSLMRTPLFSSDSDSAGVRQVMDGVNQAVRSQGAGETFSLVEAIQALRVMNEANEVMYLDGDETVYRI
ncbi:MCM DNA helicase complex subunit [Ascosphaera atra]|nr:MCM DNA helicase complex subunit [Ascosphaera atra]